MRVDAGPCYGPVCDHVSHPAADSGMLFARISALGPDGRSWVLYWLASDADPAVRRLLSIALDEQAKRARSADS